MTDPHRIADFLVFHGFTPPYDLHSLPLSWPSVPVGPFSWRYDQPPTVEDLAAELVNMTEFRALQLGDWLGTAEGELITRAVRSVLPPHFAAEITLLAEGLKLAARLQHERGRRIAGGVAVAVLVGIAVVAAIQTNSTRS